MKLAKTLLAIGRVLITCGVLLLLFVGYQLWGTGYHTQQAQDDARGEYEAALAESEANTPTTTPVEHPGRRPPRQPVPHAPAHGHWIGRLTIPAIDADFIFLEGVDLDTLQDGPGHYEGTPLPGQAGNAGIAGHRTTYLHPFYDLNELEEGDMIIINYPNGSRFRYRYLNTNIVAPDRTDVLEYKFDNRLTLTACNPRYSAAERIVVSARLVDRPGRGAPGTEPPSTAPPAEGPGLSIAAGGHSKSPAILWGIAAAMIWVTAYVLGKAWRRWPVYLLGLPLFLLALYAFFENFSHLLPADF